MGAHAKLNNALTSITFIVTMRIVLLPSKDVPFELLKSKPKKDIFVSINTFDLEKKFFILGLTQSLRLRSLIFVVITELFNIYWELFFFDASGY